VHMFHCILPKNGGAVPYRFRLRDSGIRVVPRIGRGTSERNSPTFAPTSHFVIPGIPEFNCSIDMQYISEANNVVELHIM